MVEPEQMTELVGGDHEGVSRVGGRAVDDLARTGVDCAPSDRPDPVAKSDDDVGVRSLMCAHEQPAARFPIPQRDRLGQARLVRRGVVGLGEHPDRG
jgi:hypothetical protein